MDKDTIVLDFLKLITTTVYFLLKIVEKVAELNGQGEAWRQFFKIIDFIYYLLMCSIGLTKILLN